MRFDAILKQGKLTQTEVASSLLQHGFQPIRLVPSDGGSQELALCWADSLDCANY